MSLPVGPINEQYQTPAGAGTSPSSTTYFVTDEKKEWELPNSFRFIPTTAFNVYELNGSTSCLTPEIASHSREKFPPHIYDKHLQHSHEKFIWM